MNFPAILDVGLGLVVVFFLLASICSILVEMIANRQKWRQTTLQATVSALLKGHEERGGQKATPARAPSDASANSEVAKNSHDEAVIKTFWTHPEIEPLRAADSDFPGYMDAARFATVILDIATGQGKEGVIPDSRAAFSRAFEQHAPPKLLERLNSLLRSLPAETTNVRTAINASVAKWFDEAMARTSGAYKRQVQRWLFGTGLVVALLLNCDTLRITYVLFRDPGLRNSMVDYARSVSSTGATNQPTSTGTATSESSTNETTLEDLQKGLRTQIKELQALERIGFPVGWVAPLSANFLPLHGEKEEISADWFVAALFLKIIGLVATAFAVCLGAPFWFDILNKLLKMRTAGAGGAKASSESTSSANATTGAGGASPGGAPTGTPTNPASRPRKPLPSIGEALREPSTQFNSAKAYWLAEAALLAYSEPAEIKAKVINDWRFDYLKPFNDEKTGTQAFLAVGGGVAILAFRGTEPGKLPDVKTDAEIRLKTLPEYPGAIHEGFATALASVYADVKAAVDALPGSGALLYITGHSLGAALATLCAQRLTAARGYPIQGVCTYGSPRVGNPAFANEFQPRLGQRTYRLVNNEDLVTRVPPRAAGYEHVGEMVYIDDAGRLQRDIGFWYRFLNLAANAAEDFEKAAKTTVRDHSMALYCEHLKCVATAPEA